LDTHKHVLGGDFIGRDDAGAVGVEDVKRQAHEMLPPGVQIATDCHEKLGHVDEPTANASRDQAWGVCV